MKIENGELKMEENQDNKWYDGLVEILCAVAIFIALIIAHSE